MALINTDYQPQNTIWLHKEGFAATGIVNDPNATANTIGRKYIPAGTLLAGSADFKLNPNTVLQPTTDPTAAQGVLVEQTDITAGNTRAAVAIGGVINREWLDTTVKASYSDDNVKALQAALPKITVFDRY